jgi:hypothetical protein
MSDMPTSTTQGSNASTNFPAPVLLLGCGGVLLTVGALLPWVTIGNLLSISGVTARWGLVTLAAGLGALAIAVQVGTGRLVPRSTDKALAIGGVVLGLLSFAIAIYVGFAIRDSIAEDESGSDPSSSASTGNDEIDESMSEFERSLEELFKVGTGIGVYATALGGLAVAGGAALKLRRD